MRKILFQLSICMAALLAVSCQQEDVMKRIPIFRVLGPDGTEATEISIDGKTQDVNFKVLSTGDWSVRVSDPENYIPSVTTGGTGNISMAVKAMSNETGKSRTATVTFALSGEDRYTFNITQALQLPYLEVDPHTVTVAGDGEDFTINVGTNQSSWTYELSEGTTWLTEKERTSSSITFTAPENTTGAARTSMITFYAEENPLLLDFVDVTQNKPAVAPKADLLDLVFSSTGEGSDVSAMGMTVKNDRRNAECGGKFLEKYQRNAAIFTNSTLARSGLDAGYLYVPYTTDSDFGKKLADGFTYELVFCNYFDAQEKQVKPFASTQAGGTGVCMRANTGEINFEVHVGGSWAELYSGIIPAKNQYYHVVGTWDKVNGIALLYVNGELTASKNTTGDFKFMETSVDKRWFGVGADPSSADKGEASYYGEVVIARLYAEPISSEEVKALYKLVK